MQVSSADATPGVQYSCGMPGKRVRSTAKGSKGDSLPAVRLLLGAWAGGMLCCAFT